MINPFLTYPPNSRLVVNRLNNESWRASFQGLPTIEVTAKYPIAAIRKLVARAGDPSLKFDTLRPVTEETGSDQMVFEIPRTDWRPRALSN